MCLYPRIIKNKKYTPNKKNRGEIPPVNDPRTLYLPSKCGNCIECRKQYAREWQVRLLEDIKSNKNGKFITLTFSNESYREIYNTVQSYIIQEINKIHNSNTDNKDIKIENLTKIQTGYKLDNEIATHATRLFLERYRKKYKKSIRHWLITELGHNGTENIHLHGIIWTDIHLTEIEKIWKYGFMWKGKNINGILQNYVNEKTINYIIKYVYKQDPIHSQYKSKILTSDGIGKNFTAHYKGAWTKNKYIDNNTNETYKTRQGNKLSLPIYYRNIIYTEEEKEKLWINKLDKNERWILGQKINIKNGEEEYFRALKSAQELNSKLGYGSNKKNWIKEQYELEIRKLKQEERIKNASGGRYARGG